MTARGLIPRLLGISPPDRAGALRWLDRAPELAEAGVDGLLLRVVDPSFDAEIVLPALLATGALVLLHLRTPGGLRLAEAGLVGLHLPDGLDAAPLRPRIPGLLGQSRHDRAGLLASAATGCDYATLSPIASPRSKPDDARAPLGLAGVRAALWEIHLPVLALGGLDPALAAACRAAGCWGIAGLGALADPEGARPLRAAVDGR